MLDVATLADCVDEADGDEDEVEEVDEDEEGMEGMEAVFTIVVGDSVVVIAVDADEMVAVVWFPGTDKFSV